MFGCNGHGTCGENGQCTCNLPWKGAMCYEQVGNYTDIDTYSIVALGGNSLLYFIYDSNAENWGLNITTTSLSACLFDLYISDGINSNPTEFTHDFAFRDVPYASSIILSGDLIPYAHFSAGLYLQNCFDNYNNKV